MQKNNEINTSSPLREQPDYSCFTTQEKMKQIAEQLYFDSNFITQIANNLYSDLIQVIK